MDLSTTYLGLELPHPFVAGASPLADDLDMVRQLEDAGVAAIVMRSLFEEQLVQEQVATDWHMASPADSFAEALSYLPDPETFHLGPGDYLEQLARIKAAVAVPVIGSLNGVTLGGWLEYARLIQEAGADALELNVYRLAADPDESSEAVERQTLEMVRAVRESLAIPLAVKLSPFYSSLASFARRLDEAGADGLVLFNRFYQADVDPEELEAVRKLQLSDSSSLLLRLRWLAILSGRLQLSLAASGGVHTAIDALKATLCGADAIQVVSALLRHGPERLALLRNDTEAWLVE
ncbi:MAG: dihydroorotate dehydrogenase-like protein, partial [Thermoanaerobaculia bacterium]